MNALKTPPKYFRTNVLRGRPHVVDRTGGIFGAGVVKGFSVVTRGMADGHNVWLNRDFLRTTADEINSQAKGIKSRYTHPGMSGDTIGKLLGKVNNASVEGDRVLADLHFTAGSHRSPDGDLATRIMDLAAETPEDFGASVAFIPGDELEASDPLNRALENPLPELEMDSLVAVDLVGDPAANPDGMFSRHDQEIVVELFTLLDYAFLTTGVKPAGLGQVGVDADRAAGAIRRWAHERGIKITGTIKERNDGTKLGTRDDLKAFFDGMLSNVRERDKSCQQTFAPPASFSPRSRQSQPTRTIS